MVIRCSDIWNLRSLEEILREIQADEEKFRWDAIVESRSSCAFEGWGWIKTWIWKEKTKKRRKMQTPKLESFSSIRSLMKKCYQLAIERLSDTIVAISQLLLKILKYLLFVNILHQHNVVLISFLSQCSTFCCFHSA